MFKEVRVRFLLIAKQTAWFVRDWLLIKELSFNSKTLRLSKFTGLALQMLNRFEPLEVIFVINAALKQFMLARISLYKKIYFCFTLRLNSELRGVNIRYDFYEFSNR